MNVYDTLSGRKRAFEPLVPGEVRMYVCGITPYAPAHVGHAMSAIVFDVVRRAMRRIDTDAPAPPPNAGIRFAAPPRR